MEFRIILTVLVFAVAALHLSNQVITHVHRFYEASGIRLSQSSKTPAHRDDWYMFFHCSDLTGESKKKPINKQVNKKISSSMENYQKRDSRPALHTNLPR